MSRKQIKRGYSPVTPTIGEQLLSLPASFFSEPQLLPSTGGTPDCGKGIFACPTLDKTPKSSKQGRQCGGLSGPGLLSLFDPPPPGSRPGSSCRGFNSPPLSSSGASFYSTRMLSPPPPDTPEPPRFKRTVSDVVAETARAQLHQCTWERSDVPTTITKEKAREALNQCMDNVAGAVRSLVSKAIKPPEQPEHSAGAGAEHAELKKTKSNTLAERANRDGMHVTREEARRALDECGNSEPRALRALLRFQSGESGGSPYSEEGSNSTGGSSGSPQSPQHGYVNMNLNPGAVGGAGGGFVHDMGPIAESGQYRCSAKRRNDPGQRTQRKEERRRGMQKSDSGSNLQNFRLGTEVKRASAGRARSESLQASGGGEVQRPSAGRSRSETVSPLPPNLVRGLPSRGVPHWR